MTDLDKTLGIVAWGQRIVSSLVGCTLLLTGSMTNRALASTIEPPPGQGTPKSTAGGGSRISSQVACRTSNRADQFVALSPGQQLALTTVDRPNFLIYLPQTKATALELSLFDHNRKGIYQTILPVPQTSGLVRIQLPQTAPSLSKNQPYAWSIALVCNPADRTEDWVVRGWIQRTDLAPQIQRNLTQAKAIDQVKIFAAQGFWHEAATTLMELQQQTPNDPKLLSMWQELLQSAGLNVIH
jgi:Domain of Unknown Function (DUF928)